MTVDKLMIEHKNKHPNSHFFDSDTLKFFGERKSNMRVLKDKAVISGKKCYVLSTLQRNYPTGAKRSYHYFDDTNFDVVLED